MKRYWIGRVCGVRSSGFWINHLLSISMVSDDNKTITAFGTLFNHFFHAGIHRFHSFNYGLIISGMPNHICICKIQADKIGFCLFQFF